MKDLERDASDSPAAAKKDEPDTANQAEAVEGLIVVPAPEDLQLTTACPVCREEIKRNAKLCIHCKSDFTWRRFMPVGSTTFAMLAALVAVVGAVAPQMKKLLETQDSRLSAVVVGTSVHDPILTILVTNSGTRKGVVQDLRVFVPLPSSSNLPASTVLWAAPLRGGALAIDPQSTVQMGFDWRKGYLSGETEMAAAFDGVSSKSLHWFLGHDGAGRKCKLMLNAVNGSGKVEQLMSEFECTRIFSHIFEAIERPNGRPPAVAKAASASKK
jgi:hypothetical protein